MPAVYQWREFAAAGGLISYGSDTRDEDLLSRPPLNGHDGVKPAELVLDATGVGQAVADVFDEAGLPHIRVTITAGNEVTAVARNKWHVSKSALI